jgi:uncharacterized membrane protein
VSYTLRLTNTGNAPDTFTMTVNGNSWTTSVAATVGPLASGAGTNVVVSVTVALNAAGGATDTALVTAISQGDASKVASATLTTTANTVRGVTLTPASVSQSSNPGATVTYTLRLTNTGNAVDAFTLVKGSTTFTTIVTPTSAGPLAAGTGQTVTVTVQIPPDAATGASDMAIIAATSQGNASKSASATLLTTTASMYGVFLPLVIR